MQQANWMSSLGCRGPVYWRPDSWCLRWPMQRPNVVNKSKQKGQYLRRQESRRRGRAESAAADIVSANCLAEHPEERIASGSIAEADIWSQPTHSVWPLSSASARLEALQFFLRIRP